MGGRQVAGVATGCSVHGFEDWLYANQTKSGRKGRCRACQRARNTKKRQEMTPVEKQEKQATSNLLRRMARAPRTDRGYHKTFQVSCVQGHTETLRTPCPRVGGDMWCYRCADWVTVGATKA